MKEFKYIFFIVSMVLLSFCSRVEPEFDANGHFETQEIFVSAENTGRLLYFDIEQGRQLEKGQKVGQVDTMSLSLKKDQVKSQVYAAMVKIPGLIAQKNVVEKEIEALEFEIKRMTSLVNDGAAPQKQLDDLNHNIDVANAKLKTFDTQIQSVTAEANVLETQLAIFDDQISRASIFSPITGIVLERYVRESELVSQGKILFTIANTQKMELKAYIGGSQLSQVEIGQNVQVKIDWGEKDSREYRGIISWVSDDAEFTPKIIQTREERVNLVYAIKIQVENDGKIKIGMPGEVIF